MYRNHEGYADPTAGQAFSNIRREERAKRLGYMPIVYICSPYKGDIEHNLQNARRYCAYALEQHVIPIAPHLIFPQFMGEETNESRKLALHMGHILLTHCKEVWYFGDQISDGMKDELKRARWRNIPVRHFDNDCKEVPV